MVTMEQWAARKPPGALSWAALELLLGADSPDALSKVVEDHEAALHLLRLAADVLQHSKGPGAHGRYREKSSNLDPIRVKMIQRERLLTKCVVAIHSPGPATVGAPGSPDRIDGPCVSRCLACPALLPALALPRPTEAHG